MTALREKHAGQILGLGNNKRKKITHTHIRAAPLQQALLHKQVIAVLFTKTFNSTSSKFLQPNFKYITFVFIKV